MKKIMDNNKMIDLPENNQVIGISDTDDLIYDNEKIFQRISTELQSAKNTILVAAAWFTDPDLLNILVEKVKEGVSVKVLISSNTTNEKLDFNPFIKAGGHLVRVKSNGYGIMHHKFCVIDKRMTIHGSYNWSVNARNNNDESITISYQQNLIEKMTDLFNEILLRSEENKENEVNNFAKGLLDRIFNKKNEEVKKNDDLAMPRPAKMEVLPAESHSIQEESTFKKQEYEKILDQMISAEISSFDRTLLKEEGYQRCKANNGDYQILNNSFDSIYSLYVNDINIIDDKKARLIAKIQEQKTKSINAENERTELSIKTLETNQLNHIELADAQISSLQSQIENINSEKKEIKEFEIKEVEQKNERLEEDINSLKIDFIKPPFKYYEMAPFAILLGAILIYLFLFYSSAAYILLFSQQDAMEARMGGIKIPPPEVFNPMALSLVWKKGISAVLFVLLFVSLPIGFALFDKMVNWNKYIAGTVSILLGIVIIDAFIAYKVASAVHEIKYLTGAVSEKWETVMIFTDSNFYLVFVLGVFGLIIFKVVFQKVMSFYEKRDEDKDRHKKKFQIDNLYKKIEDNTLLLKSYHHKVHNCDTKIMLLKDTISKHESGKIIEPKKIALEIEKLKSALNYKTQIIENTTDIYLSHVENDKLPISLDALKDRINLYLEGWNTYLHDQYSVKLASDMGLKAQEKARLWKEDKFQNSRIDKRLIQS